MSLIQSLGPIQYPLWIVAILMLVQIVRGITQAVDAERRHSPLRTHSILVLGTLGACVSGCWGA